MKKFRALLAVLFFLAFSMAGAKNFVVDPGFPFPMGDFYPSLDQAITGLTDSSNNLIDDSNTITLSTSCMGVPQYFPSPKFELPINGFGTRNVNIHYDIPTPVSQASDCDLLPQLVLTADSYIYLSNLASFTINGVNIQYSYSSKLNSISSVASVSISNSCFNNSESSGGLSNSEENYFYIESTTLFSMTNVVYSFDPLKVIWIKNSPQITIDNVSFVPLAMEIDLPTTSIKIFSDPSVLTLVNISNSRIICDPDQIVISNLMDISNVASVEISSFEISSCQFGAITNSSQNVFKVARASLLILDNFAITNATFALTSQRIVDYIRSPKRRLLTTAAVDCVILSNFNITRLFITGDPPISSNELVFFEDGVLNLTLKGWTLTHGQVHQNASLIHIAISDYSTFKGLDLQDFTLNGTLFAWKSGLVYFTIQAPLILTTQAESIRLRLHNINLFENEIHQGLFAYFGYTNAKCIPSVELVKLEVSSITLSKIRVFDTSLFQVEGLLTSITNLLSEGNIYSGTSNFFIGNAILGTFYLTNSTINNLNLLNGASFVSSNFTTVRDLRLEIPYITHIPSFSNPDAEPKGLNAETRPFIVYNSSFDLLNFSSNSHLFVSTNPMIIIQRNNFTRLTLAESRLLQLGNYLKFFSEKSYLTNAEGLFFWTPASYEISPFFIAEESAMQDYPDLYSLYNETRSNISLYEPQKSVFFISVAQNIIDDVKTLKKNSYLISLSNFQIENGTTMISDNTLSNIISDTDFSLFSANSLNSARFSANMLSDITIPDYIFTFSSSFVDNLVFDSIMISDTNQVGLYSIQSDECNQIAITNSQASHIQTQRIFINLACGSISTGVALQNLTLSDISQTNTPRVLSPLNFISITATTYANTEPTIPKILFENISCYNIMLSSSGSYIEGIFQSSFIVVLSAMAETTFNSSNFNSISILPSGSLITISNPVVSFNNVTLDSVSYGNIHGALHLTLTSLSVVDSVFKFNTGVGSDGAGLFKLTNPSPTDAALNVLMQNCTFQNNTAPYGTAMFIKDSPVELLMNNCDITGNRVKGAGGIFYLVNVSSSNLTVMNSSFTQNVEQIVNMPSVVMFSFENMGAGVSLLVQESNISVTNSAKGSFISAIGQQKLTLRAYNDRFYSQVLDTVQIFFNFLSADNIEADFDNLEVSNLSLGEVGVFVLNCNTAGKSTYQWSLQITNSEFNSLNLSEGLIVISADGYKVEALNNLSILLQNSTFSNITWSNSPASVSSGIAGILKTTTPLVGRYQATQSTGTNDFAILIENCTFSLLKGISGLIFGGAESLFDSIIWINNSSFDSISSSGPGAIFNPSDSALGANYRYLGVFSSSLSNSISFKVTNSRLSNISSQAGNLMHWNSVVRGVSILIANSTFANLTSKEDGGIISTKYVPASTNSTCNIDAKNNTFHNISSRNGGIVHIEGLNHLFNVTCENNSYHVIKAAQNGGVFHIYSPNATVSLPWNSHSTSSTTTSLRILSNPALIGNFSITNSHFNNITSLNGGVVYEITLNSSLNISVHASTFESISVASRGGIFFLVQPITDITGNEFLSSISANGAGTLIYSASNQGIPSDFTSSNVIGVPSSTSSLFAVYPTNLKIEFISLKDRSTLVLENNQIAPYNPIASNLTSYSLSEYQIDLTLVFRDNNQTQIVHDESSTSPNITLKFITQDQENPQKYIGDNCSHSKCTVLATSIMLQGKETDIILVNASYTSDVYTQFQQFYIRLRGCLPGEVHNTDLQQCVYCRPGTYSLNPNDSQCHTCPYGAYCHGGNSIEINSSFYRSPSNMTSLVMVPCNDSSKRCLGGYENTCADPFSGPVCLQCNLEKDYLSSGKEASCNFCYEKEKLIAISVALLAASIVYQIIMVVVTFNENKNTHSQYSIDQTQSTELKPGAFLVIFSTFLQISSIFSAFDEGGVLTSLMAITDNAANSNAQATASLQCLYKLYNPDPFKGVSFQVLVYTLSPIVKVIAVIPFELIRCLVWRDKEGLSKKKSLMRLGSIAVVLILLEQPRIIGVLSGYLSCTKLDPFVEDYYIKGHSTVQCYTEEYNFFAKAVVLPSLIFWAVLVPLAIFFSLFMKKRKKDLFKSESFSIVFGNLYNPYSANAYYWGLVVIVFKMAFYILNSVLRTSSMLKCLIFMVLIHIYYLLFKRNPPYKNKYLMAAEKYCVLAYMTMLTLILFSGSNDFEVLKKICSIFIVLVLGLAGGYVLINIFWLYLLKVISIFDQLKKSKIEKELLAQTLQGIEKHHRSNSSLQRPIKERRNAMSIDLPSKSHILIVIIF